MPTCSPLGSDAGRHRADAPQLFRLGYEALVLGNRDAARAPESRIAQTAAFHQAPCCGAAYAGAPGEFIGGVVETLG